MSIKKTWFSYILWLLATGFSILLTYNVVCKEFFKWETLPLQIIYGIIFYGAAVGLCFLIRKIWNHITLPVISKWTGRILHILIFIGCIALFVWARIWEIGVSGISAMLHTDQALCFYEMSKVGADASEIEMLESALNSVSLVPSLFEEIYIKTLYGLFLFLGNKAEIMLYFQIMLQSLAFVLLILIGWSLKKGISAWIPACFFAASPIFVSLIGNMGPANFWFFIVLLGIAILCLLEKIWKRKIITYITISVWGILFCAFVLGTKIGVLFYNEPAFLIGASLPTQTDARNIEFLVLTALLVLYCVSFWFQKMDHASLYMMPLLASVGLMMPLQYMEVDVIFFLLQFMMLWIYFVITEGLHVLFSAKPKVFTGQNAEIVEVKNTAKEVQTENAVEDFDWTEMKTMMEQKEETKNDTLTDIAVSEEGVSEDTGVIRVSEILKAMNTAEEKTVESSNKAETERIPEEDKIDRTAMIENVLPIPKKHVSRSFEYSFEPSDDMMHYDVELENDDYDYE